MRAVYKEGRTVTEQYSSQPQKHLLLYFFLLSMSNWKVFQDSLDSESQPESERELSLSQLPNQPTDPLPPQEPRNEAGLSQQRRRPRVEELLEPRQRRKIPSSRSLVIVIEVKLAFEGRPEAVFEGLFAMKIQKFKHSLK